MISIVISIYYYFIDSRAALENYNALQSKINSGYYDIPGNIYLMQYDRQYFSSILHDTYVSMCNDINILLYSGLGMLFSLICAVLGVYFANKKNIYSSVCFGVGGFINLIIGIYLITFRDTVSESTPFYLGDIHLTGAVALISGIILIITAVLAYINLNKQHI